MPTKDTQPQRCIDIVAVWKDIQIIKRLFSTILLRQGIACAIAEPLTEEEIKELIAEYRERYGDPSSDEMKKLADEIAESIRGGKLKELQGIK